MANKKSTTDDIEYKVEAVVDKRKIPCNGGCGGIIGCDCNGRIEYRIKWLGYGPECNTWEPLKHLYCEDLIEEFEKTLKSENDSSEKGKATPGSRIKSIVKRKFTTSSDSFVTKSTTHPAKRRKGSIDTIEHERTSILRTHKNYERKKSVEFKEPIPPKQETTRDSSQKKYKRKLDSPPIDPSLQAEKIIGVADSGGELMFLVKWKGKNVFVFRIFFWGDTLFFSSKVTIVLPKLTNITIFRNRKNRSGPCKRSQCQIYQYGS